MRRLYADFNDFASDEILPLICVGSLESIKALPEPLQEGKEVWFSDGELRARGRVHRCPDGSWEGRSTWVFEDDPDPGWCDRLARSGHADAGY